MRSQGVKQSNHIPWEVLRSCETLIRHYNKRRLGIDPWNPGVSCFLHQIGAGVEIWVGEHDDLIRSEVVLLRDLLDLSSLLLAARNVV